MELINIGAAIEQRIKLLEKGRGELQKRAEAKAKTLALYEKELSIVILRLKAEGQSATLIEKIARGECYAHLLEKSLAEELYKNAVVGLQAIQAEMNAYQSIYKYQQEV